MRTSVRIATGISGGVLALALVLTACGGGGNQDSSTASNDNAAKQTASAVPAAPRHAGVPATSVCEVIPRESVERTVGKTVYSASNEDLLAGAQPTLCNYYTDADAINGVTIQWMTPEDALWDDSIKAMGTTTGGDTVRSLVAHLGDGAYKEVGAINGGKGISYNVLLKGRGIVLSVTDVSGLPDATVLNLTKMAIQAVDKL